MTTIDVVNPETGAVSRQELALEATGACAVTLEALAGSSHLQIRVRENEAMALFAEVECANGETVDVRLARQADGRIQMETGLRNVYFLPVNLAAKEAILKPVETKDVEVVLLIDATALDLASDKAIGTLLQPAGQPASAWTAMAQTLTEFVEELQRQLGGSLRASVLAFGDHPLPIAPDSIPLYPASATARQLRSQSPERVYEQLTRIPRISGGDFVDALADAMDVCSGRSMNWSDGTRKLLVIFGNSPGYSVLDADLPLLELADTQTRAFDVYQEAMDLHQIGVELLTVFHDNGIDVMTQLRASAAGLLDHTRQQYARLASRPEWSYTSSGFKPHNAARDWASTRTATGRGSCPGSWVQAR